MSAGRARFILGPLGWLSQLLLGVLQIPLSTAVTVGGTAALFLSPIVPTMLSDAGFHPLRRGWRGLAAACSVPEPQLSSPARSFG